MSCEKVGSQNGLLYVCNDKGERIRSSGNRNCFVGCAIALDDGAIGGMKNRVIWSLGSLGCGGRNYGNEGASVNKPFSVFFLVVNVNEGI